MKVDGGLMGGELFGVPARAKEIEAAGYDGIVTAEVNSDPFLALTLAAEHTERSDLMTSIAVAFARTPMLLAQIGHDLNAYSKGRFILGLGSQIKPHITKRFSMEWSHPAARMREFVEAMRAIWSCWYEGKALDFRGDFYTHTLMTPMFTPTNTDFGPPRVYLAAVGPLMTEAAGAVCDGLIAHAFTTRRYMEEVTIPAVERGLASTGRSRADFEITCPTFVVTGETEEAFAQSRQAVAQQVAFYGSTPAYRPVLEMHGWGDLGLELTKLSKQGKWVEMGTLIDDPILDEFAVVAEPKDLVEKVKGRCDGVVDRLLATFSVNQQETVAALRS